MQDMHLKVDMDLILELIKHIGQTMQEVTMRNTAVKVVPPSPRKRRRSTRAASIRSSSNESDNTIKSLDKCSVIDRSSDEEAALLSHEAVFGVFSHSLNAAVHRAAAVASQAQAVYIELLHHCSLTVHVELFVGQRFQHLDLTQQMLASDSASSSSSIALGLAVLGSPVLSVLSQLVSTISHTSPSFRFNSLVVSNYFGSLQALAQILKGSLLQQLLQQIYKVFGSMEVLGDPLELVESLGTGVADFFSHTKAEMIGSADTRGEGVKRLAQAVVGGTFGSAAKMSGSLAEMVRQVAGPGIGGIVAAPLTGALGAVSVVTESVSQSAGVTRPQATQTRMRLPRHVIPMEMTPSVSQDGYGSSQNVRSASGRHDADHSSGQQVVVYSLKQAQHHEWMP